MLPNLRQQFREGMTASLGSTEMTIAGFSQHQFLTSLMFFQNPTAMLQHLEECFPGVVEAVLTALEGINADGFEIKSQTRSYECMFKCPHTVQTT